MVADIPLSPSTNPDKRKRSFSFGWNPSMGSAVSGSMPGRASPTGAEPLAIPKMRSRSDSVASSDGSPSSPIDSSGLFARARRGSVSGGMQPNLGPLLYRKPSQDEERILKGEFSPF